MATNTDRPEFQTVPAMDMEEYKGKIRAHRLKILRRTLIVFFLLAVLLAGLWLFMALRHYEDFDVTDSVEQSDTAASIATMVHCMQMRTITESGTRHTRWRIQRSTPVEIIWWSMIRRGRISIS